MGWDRARDEIFARQKSMGIVPPNTDLTPRPDWIPAWDSLTSDEKVLYARMMEVFAGFMSHTDHHIGRVLDFLRDTGELDNTITVVISDNGASAEGGPHGSLNEANFFNRVPESVQENLARIDDLGSPNAYNHYPFGWTWAGNTPFQRWKREVHEGGVADPCIVHWPARIAARGEIREQYMHAVDITPTVLDAIGVEPPPSIKGVQQSPIHGTSFLHTIDHAAEPSRHETQYYEMLGNRAIYHRGWKATTYHGTEGMIYDGVTDPSRPFDDDRWELYHVEEDFSEAHDLAAEYPEKVRELEAVWWAEAGRYNVLPIDARTIGRALGRPRLTGRRKRFVYYPGGAMIETAASVNVKNRSHSITADVVIPPEGAEGVLLAEGGRFGGYSLFVRGGKLRYAYNFLNREVYDVVSGIDVPTGPSLLGFSFEKRGDRPFGAGGIAKLYINGEQVAEADIPRTVPFLFSLGEGLECGQNSGTPVSEEYAVPFAFTGKLKRVIVDISGAEPPRDLAHEAAIEMARQ
jgi:arylsulfatase